MRIGVRFIVLMIAVLFVFGGVGASHAKDQAGKFDYYALALSWSPSYCASAKHAKDSLQCNNARPFAFVVHGLWPQYERGWPQNCRLRKRPWVPETLIDKMLDIMPSRKLVIHEYKKHGTCSGLSPDAYFALVRRIYKQITIPERFQRLSKPLAISPDEVEAEFLKANPALKPEMVSIVCRGSRLSELRICFSRDETLQACGVNETQRKLCNSRKIVMPPVRGGQ
ncbi:MAG: ribonuclease T [Alphaproteobacteria bacterium]